MSSRLATAAAENLQKISRNSPRHLQASSAGRRYIYFIVADYKDSLTGPLLLEMAKVDCNVDAQYSSIDVGDLLTTSPLPAMP
jgi:hypothetical protein